MLAFRRQTPAHTALVSERAKQHINFRNSKWRPDGSSHPKKMGMLVRLASVEGETVQPDANVLVKMHAGDVLCRAFDITIALLAILIALPLFVFAAIAIKLSSAGPVIFVQSRVGKDGVMFPCLKFRSMIPNSQEVLEKLLASCPEASAEWARDQKLRNDPRITAVGNLLRKTSLDELPQLINVLLGQMSIVGPRPITQSEVSRYGTRFTAYCSVRPGLTGLWQVSGRNSVSYEARVRLDARYALQKSLTYDFAICLRTIPAVLASRGCY